MLDPLKNQPELKTETVQHQVFQQMPKTKSKGHDMCEIFWQTAQILPIKEIGQSLYCLVVFLLFLLSKATTASRM